MIALCSDTHVLATLMLNLSRMTCGSLALADQRHKAQYGLKMAVCTWLHWY